MYKATLYVIYFSVAYYPRIHLNCRSSRPLKEDEIDDGPRCSNCSWRRSVISSEYKDYNICMYPCSKCSFQVVLNPVLNHSLCHSIFTIPTVALTLSLLVCSCVPCVVERKKTSSSIKISVSSRSNNYNDRFFAQMAPQQQLILLNSDNNAQLHPEVPIILLLLLT